MKLIKNNTNLFKVVFNEFHYLMSLLFNLWVYSKTEIDILVWLSLCCICHLWSFHCWWRYKVRWNITK